MSGLSVRSALGPFVSYNEEVTGLVAAALWTCFILVEDSFLARNMPQWPAAQVAIRVQICHDKTMYRVLVERRFYEEYYEGNTLREKPITEWTALESYSLYRKEGSDYDPKPYQKTTEPPRTPHGIP